MRVAHIEEFRHAKRVTPLDRVRWSLETDSEEVTGDDLLFLWKNKVYFTLMEVDDILHLEWIKSRKPGRGDGTRFMLELVRLADKEKVVIELYPCPLGHVGMKQAQLVDFYRKFDFEYQGKNIMRRLPKNY